MFTDKTESFQKLLDAGNGIVTFPDGEHLISRPLEISDRTRLVCSPRTHLKLADSANCPIIKNRDKGRDMTRHVTIEGGIWDGNNLNQQRDKPTYDSFKNFYSHLMGFTYVEDFMLRGVTIKDPEAFGIQLTAAIRFTVADITFDYNMKCLNMDGIHVNGFAREGHITNIKGTTNDDLVALNSDEGFHLGCDNCDMENITIDGIYGGHDGWTGVRLLSRTAKVKNITIRNVYGSYKYNAVSFTHWAAEPGDYGWFDGITLDGIFASSVRKSGTGHGGLIWFQPGVHHVGTVMINNVMRIDEFDAFNEMNTIEVSDDVIIDTLLIRGLRQCVPDEKAPVLIVEGAKVRCLEVM